MKTPKDHSFMLTVSETAKLLQLDRFKVYLLIEDHLLDAYKFGPHWRITSASVERLLNPICKASSYEVPNTSHKQTRNRFF